MLFDNPVKQKNPLTFAKEKKNHVIMLKVRKRVKIFENTFHCTALYFYDLCLSIKVYILLKKKT